MLKEIGIERLYYFASIKNLSNILAKGILSKNEVERQNLYYDSFANEEVQNKRHTRYFFLSNNILSSGHDCVPLYMRPLSPTQYACKSKELDFLFFVFDSDIISNLPYAFSNGNIACKNSKIFNTKRSLKEIPVKVIKERYWNHNIDGRRKASSEILIHKKVPIENVMFIIVSSLRIKKMVENQLAINKLNIQIKVNKNYYFTQSSLIIN